MLADALISLSKVNGEITKRAKRKHRICRCSRHKPQLAFAAEEQEQKSQSENGKVEERKQPRHPIEICGKQQHVYIKHTSEKIIP